MQKNDLESRFLTILENFVPKDRKLEFGESYWRILFAIVDLGRKRFSFEDVVRRVNESSVWRNEPVSIDDCKAVIKKLEQIMFVDKDLNGFFWLLPGVADALSEFFGFVWRPRGGKTGFLRYLTKSEKRVMLWYCLYRKSPLSSQEASQLTGLSKDKCNKYLKRFLKQGLLSKSGEKYHLINGERISKGLLLRYETFCMAEPTLVDRIIEVMIVHEEMSGKQVCEHLKALNVRCDPSTVYKHLRNLQKKKAIRKTGKVKKVRGTLEEYYSLNYENVERYKEQILSEIDEMIKKSGLRILDSFSIEAKKQKPHALEIFLKELQWLFLQDEHQIASFDLWIPFIRELSLSEIRKLISEIPTDGSREEIAEKLAKMSRTYNISPLTISILLLSRVAMDTRMQ